MDCDRPAEVALTTSASDRRALAIRTTISARDPSRRSCCVTGNPLISSSIPGLTDLTVGQIYVGSVIRPFG